MIIEITQRTEIPDGLDSGMQFDIVHYIDTAAERAVEDIRSHVSATGIYVTVEKTITIQ